MGLKGRDEFGARVRATLFKRRWRLSLNVYGCWSKARCTGLIAGFEHDVVLAKALSLCMIPKAADSSIG